jgi:hypothetical protein
MYKQTEVEALLNSFQGAIYSTENKMNIPLETERLPPACSAHISLLLTGYLTIPRLLRAAAGRGCAC